MKYVSSFWQDWPSSHPWSWDQVLPPLLYTHSKGLQQVSRHGYATGSEKHWYASTRWCNPPLLFSWDILIWKGSFSMRHLSQCYCPLLLICSIPFWSVLSTLKSDWVATDAKSYLLQFPHFDTQPIKCWIKTLFYITFILLIFHFPYPWSHLLLRPWPLDNLS